MPQVHLVDMRDELKDGNRSMFSRQLHEALLQRLERGEQSVLLAQSPWLFDFCHVPFLRIHGAMSAL